MRTYVEHTDHRSIELLCLDCIFFMNLLVVQTAWSDDDLIAQAFLFFIAGFETVSTAMSFALYELAVNPDVQDKLVAEIRENEVKNGGKFDYNSIQNMVYMDMVVSGKTTLTTHSCFLNIYCFG
jgi:hypothetical protein